MTKNPFINAAAAAAYIGLIVAVIFVGLGPVEHELPERLMFLMPLMAISLFTLSAAVMGYVFLYEPIVLFLAGHHKEGTTLFLQTVGIFAAITLVLLVGVVAITR